MRKTTKRRVAHKRRKRVSGASVQVVSGTKRKRKKSVTHHTKKRRKVKGIGSVTGSNIGDTLLGVAVGFGAGLAIDKFAPDSISSNMKNGGKGIIAVLSLAMGMRKKKNNLLIGVGVGLAGQTAYDFAKSSGILQGITDMMSGGNSDTMRIEMNGINDNYLRSISGPNQMLPVIQGAGSDFIISGNAMPNVLSGQNF